MGGEDDCPDHNPAPLPLPLPRPADGGGAGDGAVGRDRVGTCDGVRALGAGVGLLLSDYLPRETRKGVGWTLLAIGGGALLVTAAIFAAGVQLGRFMAGPMQGQKLEQAIDEARAALQKEAISV